MRTDLFTSPERAPKLIIEEWQFIFCEEHKAATALFSFFSYWHSIKIDQASKSKKANRIAEMHGDEGTQDTTLYQFHTESEIEKALFFFKRDAIRDGIAKLVDLGVITVHKNPNARYHFDKTRYFLFHPDKVHPWLDAYVKDWNSNIRSSENRSSIADFPSSQADFQSPQADFQSAITESSSESSSEEGTRARNDVGDTSTTPLSKAKDKKQGTKQREGQKKESIGETESKGERQTNTNTPPAPPLCAPKEVFASYDEHDPFSEEPLEIDDCDDTGFYLGGIEEEEEEIIQPEATSEVASVTSEVASVTSEVASVRIRIPAQQAALVASEKPPAELPKVRPAKKLAPTATEPVAIFVQGVNTTFDFDRQEFINTRTALLKLAGEERPGDGKVKQAQSQLTRIAETSPVYCSEKGVMDEVKDYLANYKKPTEPFVIEWFVKHVKQLSAGTIKRKPVVASGVVVRSDVPLETRTHIDFDPSEL